jgi:hypothetical protein
MTQRYAHLHDEALKKGSNIAVNIFKRVAAAEEEKGEATNS